MRKIVYDCYYKETKMMTVSTMKEAKEWKAKNLFNTVKETLIKVEEKPETAKEKEVRLTRIAKRQNVIRNKHK